MERPGFISCPSQVNFLGIYSLFLKSGLVSFIDTPPCLPAGRLLHTLLKNEVNNKKPIVKDKILFVIIITSEFAFYCANEIFQKGLSG
jgi:hypothetical protein